MSAQIIPFEGGKLPSYLSRFQITDDLSRGISQGFPSLSIKGKEFAVIESVKAASEVYSPLSGEVVEVNPELGETPALVNDDPLGRGWLVKLCASDRAELDSLMDEAAYAAFLKTL